MRYEKVKLGDLNHGDQIAVKGCVTDLSPWLLPLVVHTGNFYYHHGIFDKENMAVIDFYGDTKSNARPQRRDFTEFFAGHSGLYRVVYEGSEQCLPVSEVMERAEDAVEKQSLWPGYNIIMNNCESFATYLKTGKVYSEQAFKAIASFARNPVPSIVAAGMSPFRKLGSGDSSGTGSTSKKSGGSLGSG